VQKGEGGNSEIFVGILGFLSFVVFSSLNIDIFEGSSVLLLLIKMNIKEAT